MKIVFIPGPAHRRLHLTSSLGLDSIPTKNAGAPALSITSGFVLLEAMATLRANLANVKSMEDS